MARQSGKKGPTLYDLFHKNPLAGKGISKNDKLPRTFKNFFKLSWWHMSTIISVNLLFLVGNFPIFFLGFGFSGFLNETVPSPASSIYSVLFGAMQESADPVTAALYGIHGAQGVLSATTTPTMIMYAIGALLVLTFGLTNIGTTYILRNLIKGDPVFVWHDFWYAIKRNLRQGIIMGVIDLFVMALIVYDVAFFYFNMGVYVGAMMFFAALFLGAVYFVMRFYIYNLIITFDLSLPKIIKNAFIFSALGIKRNILAFLGIACILLLDYYFLLVLMPLGIMLPIIVLYGYCAYIASYAAWPKIKEIMVDPYEAEHQGEDGGKDVTEEAPIFTDDV